jgi:hypothetical protein
MTGDTANRNGAEPDTFELEARLRAELSRLPIDRPPAEVLDRIRTRSETESDRSPRAGYLTALAAGTLALIASVVALTGRSADRERLTEAATQSQADLAIAPPSYWWLAAIALFGAAAAMVARRVLGAPLAAIAIATLTAAGLTFAAVELSFARQAASITARAPELAGFELIGAELNPWPGLESADWAILTYRPDEPLGSTYQDGSPDADQQLLAIAESLQFNDGLPNLRRPCLKVLKTGQRPPPELPAWQDREQSDYFCARAISDGNLEVSASGHWAGAVWYRWLVGYPLLGLGTMLGLLAIGERATGTRRPTVRQVGYGLSLTCLGGALFLLGSIAVDAFRVGRLGDALNCRLALQTTDADWTQCRDHVIDTVSEAGLRDAAELLYWPAIVVADTLSLMLIGAGWLVGRAATGPVHDPTGRRRKLLLALTIVAVGLAVPQLVFSDTIDITTDVFE